VAAATAGSNNSPTARAIAQQWVRAGLVWRAPSGGGG